MVNRKQRKSKRTNCRKCDDDSAMKNSEAGNDPSWYNRFPVPHIGINWAHLSRTGVDGTLRSQVMNTHARFLCDFGLPVDTEASFMRAMRDLYAELRESNTGAASYTPNDLAAYVSTLVALEAGIAHVGRIFKSSTMKNELFVDSPYIFSAIAGHNNRDDLTSNFGTDYNKFALLVTDTSALPQINISLRDRLKYFARCVFVDEECTRPSTYTFVPSVINYLTRSTPGGSLGFAQMPLYPSTGISTKVGQLQVLYDLIVTDDTFSIIRGDLIKAFGKDAFHWDFGFDLDYKTPYPVVYSREVLDQIHNACHVEIDMSAGGSFTRSISNSTGVISYSSVSPDSWIQAWFGNDPVIIDADAAVTDEYLMELTRLHSVFGATSGSTSVYPVSGILIGETEFINAVSSNSTSTAALRTMLSNARSSVQSTAMDGLRDMATYSQLCAHFPIVPMDSSGSGTMLWDIREYTRSVQAEMLSLGNIANRSLCLTHLPRRTDGRIDKGGAR